MFCALADVFEVLAGARFGVWGVDSNSILYMEKVTLTDVFV